MRENEKKMPETAAEVAIDEIERALRSTRRVMKQQVLRLKQEVASLERLSEVGGWDTATAESLMDGQMSALVTDIAGLVAKAKGRSDAIEAIKMAVEWREEQDAKEEA